MERGFWKDVPILIPLFVVTLLIANSLMFISTISAEDNVRNPNLALMKTAKQISTHAENGPHKAVDGSTSLSGFYGHCSMTKSSDYWQWWMVDLDTKHTIRSVVVTLQNTYFNQFRIEVSTEDITTLKGFPGPTEASVCLTRPLLKFTFEFDDVKSKVLACDEPVTGRYVRLLTNNPNGRQKLVLCEFEVYSHIAKPYTVPQRSENNLAYKKETAQSSISEAGAQSNLAVDGNLHGLFKQFSCSHTRIEPTPHWWFVDLGTSYIIDSVRLVNRLDCCQDRLQKFTIHVSTNDPTTSPEFPEKIDAVMCHNQTDIVPYRTPVTFVCDAPVAGRYVMVVKGGTALCLCEFEVFGKNQEQTQKQFYLEYVTSYALDQQAIASVLKMAANCTEIYEREKMEVKKYHFIQVGLKTGECRFLPTKDKALASLTSPWILYKYIN